MRLCKGLAPAGITLELQTATSQWAERLQEEEYEKRQKKTCHSEGTCHLQLISNGQGSSQHVAFIQNHPQPDCTPCTPSALEPVFFKDFGSSPHTRPTSLRKASHPGVLRCVHNAHKLNVQQQRNHQRVNRQEGQISRSLDNGSVSRYSHEADKGNESWRSARGVFHPCAFEGVAVRVKGGRVYGAPGAFRSGGKGAAGLGGWVKGGGLCGGFEGNVQSIMNYSHPLSLHKDVRWHHLTCVMMREQVTGSYRFITEEPPPAICEGWGRVYSKLAGGSAHPTGQPSRAD
ncbi:MAG: hypothetical protein FRX49_10855 [Trebouxia sp. A1-2]|nr:MAG: hypothetical protein FRX49_10855 [Trebouxia sp. A1-2]